MSANEIFQEACKKYDNCVELVNTMGKLIQQAIGEDRYDLKVAQAQFDVILQGVLLHIAVADGYYSDIESQFIDKITDRGDLMSLIRSKTNGQLDMTWADVKGIRPDNQQKLVSLVDSWLEETCDEFVMPLAAVDSATNGYDELDMLTKNMAGICALFCQVDGNSDDAEAKAAASAVVELVIAPWKKYMKN